MITRNLYRRPGLTVSRMLRCKSAPRVVGVPTRSRQTQRNSPALHTHLSSISSWRRFHTSSAVSGMLHFKLPDIGEGIAEVEMLKWHVEVGQKVDHFDDLCEVQSDKSTAEISSPVDGTVRAINFAEGNMIQVGQVLCEIETESENTEEDHAPEQSPPEPVGTGYSHSERDIGHTVDSRMMAEGGDRTVGIEVRRAEQVTEKLEKGDKGLDNAYEDEASTSSDPSAVDDAAEYSGGARFQGEAAILPSAPSPTVTHDGITPVPRREAGPSAKRKIVLSSPAVRALARRLDVDLKGVTGSGEKGRIRKEDVEAFATSQGVAAASSEAPSALRQVSDAQRNREPDSTRVDFGRTRKVMWKALTPQGAVPHFGYSHTLDLTPLLPYLKALNPGAGKPSPASYRASDIPESLSRDPLAGAPPKATLLTFFVKTMLMALEEHPVMRSRVMTKDDQRWLDVRRDPIIGVAVSDPKFGLLTPSLPPLTPSAPLNTITSHLSSLRAKATAPSPASSVVISSVGGLGESTGAMPVLPPGGPIAICAIGKAKWEIEWVMKDSGTKVGPADVEKAGTRPVLRCPVGWSGDHRVLEGAELIAFTESWKKLMEEPWRWLRLGG